MSPEPRVIHLNGAPGVGKSTLARLWAADHPDTLLLDVDTLRMSISGWHEDFERAGALIRPVALAMITAYAAGGHDVVFPQLLANPVELARFRAAAEDGGARWVEVLLTAPVEQTVLRFTARGVSEPWQELVAGAVAAADGEPVRQFHARLLDVAAVDPDVQVLESIEGDPEATYAALVALVGSL